MADPEFITAILHPHQFAQVAALELEASGGLGAAYYEKQ